MCEKAERPEKHKLIRARRKQIKAVIRQAKGSTFSKTIVFEDVNYRLAGPEDQWRYGISWKSPHPRRPRDPAVPVQHRLCEPSGHQPQLLRGRKPLALKFDFALSFCELIIGSKTGLEAIEKTVIDRVAQALDLYVNGSLNFFNHRTTVDISNRLVCFDIKGLGKNLKKPGMLIVQDAVWNTVTINRAIGWATWYFVNEFHLLLKEEQTAAYSAEIWKRFRKWGSIPTGAAQNPKDLLSSPEIENRLENSDFIYMLNQTAGDQKILAERLNIACNQLRAEPRAAVLQQCHPALCG